MNTPSRSPIAQVPQAGSGKPHPAVEGELRLGGFGPRFFKLLAAIEQEGSLIGGARLAGLSYKGAWDMLEKAGMYSPRALIERNPGGGHDRGTRLTEAGQALLALYLDCAGEFEGLLGRLNHRIGESPLALQWLRGLHLRSSARNQWSGTIVSVNVGSVAVWANVQLHQGTLLSVRLTRTSSDTLDLQHGDSVLVLLKSSQVMLAAATAATACSETNCFEGALLAVTRAEGSPEVEVAIRLDGGERVMATLSRDEFDALKVTVGARLSVLLDSDALILAARPKATGQRMAPTIIESPESRV